MHDVPHFCEQDDRCFRHGWQPHTSATWLVPSSKLREPRWTQMMTDDDDRFIRWSSCIQLSPVGSDFCALWLHTGLLTRMELV